MLVTVEIVVAVLLLVVVDTEEVVAALAVVLDKLDVVDPVPVLVRVEEDVLVFVELIVAVLSLVEEVADDVVAVLAVVVDELELVDPVLVLVAVPVEEEVLVFVELIVAVLSLGEEVADDVFAVLAVVVDDAVIKGTVAGLGVVCPKGEPKSPQPTPRVPVLASARAFNFMPTFLSTLSVGTLKASSQCDPHTIVMTPSTVLYISAPHPPRCWTCQAFCENEQAPRSMSTIVDAVMFSEFFNAEHPSSGSATTSERLRVLFMRVGPKSVAWPVSYTWTPMLFSPRFVVQRTTTSSTAQSGAFSVAVVVVVAAVVTARGAVHVLASPGTVVRSAATANGYLPSIAMEPSFLLS